MTCVNAVPARLAYRKAATTGTVANMDYIRRAHELDERVQELRAGAPDTMKAFAQLVRAARAEGALDTKVKELMALAISICKQCEGCIAFHARGAQHAGATREEVMETISVAIEMGGGPAMVYATEALEAFDQFNLHPER